MKKKILGVITAAAVLAAQLTTVFAASDFSDMTDEYEWAETYVDDMVSAGIIKGYDDGTFRPASEVTRLEVLALFARAMGSEEDINEPIVELALEQYEDAVDACNLSWGEEEISYLLYKGVLKESDLSTYLKGDAKNEAMPRYESAIIITKAMYGEKEAKSNVGVTLSYTDQKDIPSDALQYVAYVYDQGIMKGRDDGSFGPLDGVTRAEMAVMLSRTTKLVNYSYKNVTLVDVDTDEEMITYDDDGDEIEKAYTDSTTMKVLGAATQPAYMPENVEAVLSFSNSSLMTVDALSAEPDREVSGTYIGRTSSSGKVKSITIREISSGEEETYECSDDFVMYYDGATATLSSFTTNSDIVTLTIKDGKAAIMSAEVKSSTITGATIENVTIDPFEMTISHSDPEYDGNTYSISSTVTVTKNGEDADFQSVYKGDTVTLTLEYGVITKVKATSSTTTKTGTIVSYTVSSSPTMTVSINGVEYTYDIPTSVVVTVNDEEGSLYDFRVGDSVTLTLESEAITKISATSVQSTDGNITGTITAVNTAYGFIRIEYESGSTTATEIVYIGSSKTKILTRTGTEITISKLKEGNTVNCIGTVSNGAFTATIITVLAD